MTYTADLVTVATVDGISLTGALRRPASNAASPLGLDLWILHHGIGGSFYRGGMFDRLSAFLLDAGCAVLRVNNRGSELISNGQRAGQPVRLGAAYESVADCVYDWRAWNDFAAAQGFARVALWGHSLGAVKTIYSLAADPDPRVMLAVASSPPRFAFEMFVQGPDADEFRQQYEQAQRLVDQGHGATLVEMTLPTRAVLSASTFVDKYGPATRYDILDHLPSVETPLLLTVGGLEATGPQRIAFSEHETAIGRLAETRRGLVFHLVPEADHFYTGQESALWGAVRNWATGAQRVTAGH